jgi:hypothetical protein
MRMEVMANSLAPIHEIGLYQAVTAWYLPESGWGVEHEHQQNETSSTPGRFTVEWSVCDRIPQNRKKPGRTRKPEKPPRMPSKLSSPRQR